MIEIIENGDIFESKMQTITVTTNLVSVAGKGLALEFKKRYPKWYGEYCEACNTKMLGIGKLVLHKRFSPWILSFPTKIHWRYNSELSYIEKGLDCFICHYREIGIQSIAFPALGCTNGGLDWDIVKQIMVEKLENLPIDMEIYSPLSV